jgi:hypothetical protein
MSSRFVIAILASTALMPPPAKAQIRGIGATPGTVGIGGRPGVVGSPGTRGSGVVVGPTHFHHAHPFSRNPVFLGYPYYYPDYGYDYEEAPPAQVAVVPAAAPVQSPPAAPLEPLLIEWQGDHFVRMTLSEKASASGQSSPDYSERSNLRSPSPKRSTSARKDTVEPRHEAPPAVLVFRDGRKEEVSSYTIMSGTIYSKADYWTSGSWTRKIQIADLDVPATLALNHERGLKFALPAGPNEVVVRP